MDELETLLNELISGEDERAEEAAGRLAEMGVGVVPHLQRWLSSDEVERRWWATRTLAQMNDPQVLPLLLKALRDEDLSVRQCAALALRHHPSPQSIPALLEALQGADRLLARLAGDALAAIGEVAVPDLLQVLGRAQGEARLEAMRALALMRSPKAMQSLLEALDGDSALLEYWANEGLERLGVGMTFFKPGTL